MSEEARILRKIESKLDRILKWTRFAGMQQLRDILADNLKDDASMLIYEYSDGKRSTREIAKLVGLKSNQTVVNYWKRWMPLGIVEPSPQHKGRFQRICSLEEVGLTVPPARKINTAKEEKTTKESNE